MLHNEELRALCPCRNEVPIIRLEEFPDGGSGEVHLTAHHIIFVLRGSVRYTVSGYGKKGLVISAGEFIFLPVATVFTFRARKGTAGLLIRLEDVVGMVPECHLFRFQRLDGSSKVPKVEENGFYPLKSNEQVKHFVKGVSQIERDGLRCRSYARLITGHLLFLIQAYYSQEEYMRFYSNVATADVVFADFVRKNIGKYKTAIELAGALNLSTQQLTARFRRIFGNSPHSWMNKERARHIYHDVCSSHKTLKTIAVENGFTATPNFTRYFRAAFGRTPSEVRKQLNGGKNDLAEE